MNLVFKHCNFSLPNKVDSIFSNLTVLVNLIGYLLMILILYILLLNSFLLIYGVLLISHLVLAINIM